MSSSGGGEEKSTDEEAGSLAPTILLQGWLLKWTNYLTNYQRRYFVLRDNVLSYYLFKEDVQRFLPRGSISMIGARLFSYQNIPTKFEIRPENGRNLFLIASSKQKIDTWLEMLKAATELQPATKVGAEDDCVASGRPEEKDNSPPLKPAPKSKKELLMEANTLGMKQQSNEEVLDSKRKKLIQCIWNSYNINRAIGHASIFIFGTTGTGKTSSINKIFDLAGGGIKPAKTSGSKSTTITTTEYNIINDYPNFDVADVELGIVDSPGLSDIKGEKQDACNYLSIQEFFKSHPKYPDCYPNLILVFIKGDDPKIDGENSDFVKSLRSLKKLALVDMKHPNVIGIITFAVSLGVNEKRFKSNLENKRRLMKRLIFQHLEVEAEVVPVENSPERYDLKQNGNFTELPDGNLQPKNMYDACKNLLAQNKDDFGLIALNSAFSGTGDKRIEVGHSICATDTSINRMSVQEENIMDFLKEDTLDTMESLQKKALFFIQENSLEKPDVAEIEKVTTELQKLSLKIAEHHFLSQDTLHFFTGVDIKSSLICQYLDYLGIEAKEPVQLKNEVLLRGYNTVKDRILPIEIFNSKLETEKFGILVPEASSLVYKNVFETIVKVDEYELEMQRLGKLESHDEMAAASSSAGSNNTNNSKKCSVLLEFRMFEVSIDDYSNISLIDIFKDDVESIDQESFSNLEEFFETWGHSFIVKAYGGGSVEIEINTDCPSIENIYGLDVKNKLQNLFTSSLTELKNFKHGRFVESNFHDYMTIIGQSRLSWQGGDKIFHNQFTLGNAELLNKWKLSLMRNPVMLKTRLSLVPIICLIPTENTGLHMHLESLRRGEASKQICDNPSKLEMEREPNQARKEELTRDDILVDPENEENCFPGFAKVRRRRNGIESNIEIEQLEVGDFVWSKSGYSKVILFAHYAPKKSFQYLKINATGGNFVRLSRNHLIFISDIKHTKMAYEIKPGDKLILQESELQCDVVSMEEMQGVGFYCPITEDGTIYVDGILTSCYASCKTYAGIDGHYLAHLGLLPMRLMNIKSGHVKEMHPYIKFLENLHLPFRL